MGLKFPKKVDNCPEYWLKIEYEIMKVISNFFRFDDSFQIWDLKSD